MWKRRRRNGNERRKNGRKKNNDGRRRRKLKSGIKYITTLILLNNLGAKTSQQFLFLAKEETRCTCCTDRY
jgi:hypothetical protein